MVEVWAHRGASAHAPENTLVAFREAIDQGAEGIEFDVQLSSDGHPVVIHDESLERTTDGTGWVKDHSLADLLTLDASAGRDSFTGVGIPRLEEVLEVAAGSGVRVNVELKNSEFDYPGLEQIVLAAVAAAGLADRAVYSSFSHDSVRRLATQAPMAEVGLIYSRPPVRPLRTAIGLGASAIHPARGLVSGAGWVGRARRRGLVVRPWVVNTPAKMRRMIQAGVAGFFTDEVAVAVAVVKQGAE